MIVELKPEQEQILDRAVLSGMSAEEVMDQAFAVIQEQQGKGDWMLQDRDAIAAHIAEGFAQAVRGDLIGAADVKRILRERRAKRKNA